MSESILSEPITLERHDGVAVLTIDVPRAPVNTVSPALLDSFERALDAIEGDPSVRAAVLISGKPDTFVAGADLRLFQTIASPEEMQAFTRRAHALLGRVRAWPKPTVAAVHGAALGGGLEMTLVCTYRVATDHPKTKFALPEVQLGLLPGGGGTQYLPRLIGLPQALPLMLTGRTVYPRKARKLGLVDTLVPRPLLRSAALEAANALADGTLRPDRSQGLGDRLLASNPLTRRLVYQKAREQVLRETHGNYPAPLKIIECVKSGLEDGLEAGLQAEVEHFAELVFSPPSRALVRLFFLKQEGDKNPFAGEARAVDTIAVLGAGLMGAGIAQVSAGGDLDVLLKDQTLEQAAQGKELVWKAVSKRVRKRALSAFERDVLVERVVPVADYERFDTVDLTIEAVPESLGLKQSILQEVESRTDDEAIFASNTSSIPISEIAAGAARPEAVLGMHYFSPVPKMPLLEIIRTEQTADWAVGTAVEVGLRQGKTVIVVNDGPGFYTTRILALYMNEAFLMFEEGADVKMVDRAMERWGFPMGPFELADLVGVDVGAKISDVMGGYLTDRPLRLSTAAERLVAEGWLGQKTGLGFYRYEPGEGARTKKTGLNEPVYRVVDAPRRAFEEEEVQRRLGLTMVNEAVRCLEEGILQSAEDGDLGAVFGLGFPPFRGGPFSYVDARGAQAVALELERLAQTLGPRFTPAALLREHARTGARLTREAGPGAAD